VEDDQPTRHREIGGDGFEEYKIQSP
jgi:hypothetical protein